MENIYSRVISRSSKFNQGHLFCFHLLAKNYQNIEMNNKYVPTSQSGPIWYVCMYVCMYTCMHVCMYCPIFAFTCYGGNIIGIAERICT